MATQTKDLSVFIGRFSVFHNGHAEVLKRAINTSKIVLVLIGSSGLARTTKNPFTFNERASIIQKFVDGNFGTHNTKVIIKPIFDHPYNDQDWIMGVQQAVTETIENTFLRAGPAPNVYITGADRDRSTWYLNAFGSLFKPDIVTKHAAGLDLNATDLRSILFAGEQLSGIAPFVPVETIDFLKDFRNTHHYKDLVDEHDFLCEYKKSWATVPYAPTFVTTDACVIQSGHVLVNVRDNFPGRGLWALPGGFLEQGEKLIDGCVRELIEETRIELSKAQLYGSIKSKEIFDHPDRSLRGRTITTCFLFKLDDTKPLPKVKPQKGEVQKVMWIPINEALANTNQWFEDHHSLLATMVGRIPS